MIEDMSTVRITETELARDVHAVLEKVRQGVEVIVEQVPLIDLMIGSCALELGYAIGTDNERS